MKENSLKVYTNRTQCGDLSYEDEQYIFNYKNDANSVVSLTMPISILPQKNQTTFSKLLFQKS